MHPRTRALMHPCTRGRKAKLAPTPWLGELPFGRPRAGEVGDEGRGSHVPGAGQGGHNPGELQQAAWARPRAATG